MAGKARCRKISTLPPISQPLPRFSQINLCAAWLGRKPITAIRPLCEVAAKLVGAAGKRVLAVLEVEKVCRYLQNGLLDRLVNV